MKAIEDRNFVAPVLRDDRVSTVKESIACPPPLLGCSEDGLDLFAPSFGREELPGLVDLEE
jgi:hypothetical protein